MTELAATIPDASTDTRAARLRGVVLLSLLVTAAAAIVALVPATLFDVRWSLAFVYLRWGVVFVLLMLPLVHQFTARRGRAWHLPWALRTPATALLLTCEGIVWDIVSARLRG